MGHSNIQMYVIIVGTILHVGWNILFVNVHEYGVIGTGLAATLTNFIILVATVAVTRRIPELKEAN